MKLFRIIVLHGAPKDSHTSTETYLVAKDDEAVCEWISANKHYGYWFECDKEDEPSLRTIELENGEEKEGTFQEWVMANRGDLTDENGWENAYYGVTKWGWEPIKATEEEMAVLLKLGIAQPETSADEA